MDKTVLSENAGREDAALLKVEHLCKDFGSVRAVDDVSFEIRKGEVFGLVGESGCGKTTIGRCIVGLYGITSGSVYFRGERIGAGSGSREASARRTKKSGPVRQIQMIFQDPIASLDPRMTVRDIIAEGLIIRGERDKKEIERKVFETLELVGLLPEHAGRYPHEFSGGQRQRIGIARALVMRPELIIADEPVSALDVSVRAQVINLLNDLRERFGLTLLFIAHDLSVVRYFSDRIGVMYRGRLVETAPADELFRNPLHPYTRALLSAIPLPDPVAGKKRKRIVYDPPAASRDSAEKPCLREAAPGHFVLDTEEENQGGNI